MNILQASSARSSAPGGALSLKKLGLGVIVGFTLKGLITAMLLAITLFEFIHY
jgi:hypothetical protein